MKAHQNPADAGVSAYDVRRPDAADVPAIHRLVAACDTEVLGRPDMTQDDVADALADPGLDPSRDAWLLRGSDGGEDPVGWGYAVRQGSGGGVEIEVYARDPEAGAWLWRTVLGRAREIAAELGLPAAVVDIGVYRQDEGKRASARAHGFAPATSFHRLRIEHTRPDPGGIPGVTVHPASGLEELMRAAHRIHQEGFAEHFGFVPKEYDRWKEDFEASATHDWSQLLLAEADGHPAGMLLGSDMFAADENHGYVRILAVLPEFRGRGIGRLLLRHAFAADARRGRVGTYLHVDSGNTSPALDLYRSVGMRPVLVIDVWRRTL
ncbi:GNAT family N-acetyltransferase [Sphaerisporangium album]|uniref:GNAT family N-acetyltransferase n=1 Tax=Sphaerisporangium album TaxID=509200 RepID=UPI001FE2B8A4|nr:GNAT family N-acetyltransferase [Sphaerisporangium album]